MKDGLICGVVMGMIVGMLLYKHNPSTKELVNKTEEAVKNEIKNMSSK